MIWILILILSHPILVKPPLNTFFVFPEVFSSEEECDKVAHNEVNKSSVIIGYCQEIKPVMLK